MIAWKRWDVSAKNTSNRRPRGMGWWYEGDGWWYKRVDALGLAIGDFAVEASGRVVSTDLHVPRLPGGESRWRP